MIIHVSRAFIMLSCAWLFLMTSCIGLHAPEKAKSQGDDRIAREILTAYRSRLCSEELAWCVSDAVFKYGLTNAMQSLLLITNSLTQADGRGEVGAALHDWLGNTKHRVVSLLSVNEYKMKLDDARRHMLSIAEEINSGLANVEIDGEKIQKWASDKKGIFMVCRIPLHLWYDQNDHVPELAGVGYDEKMLEDIMSPSHNQQRAFVIESNGEKGMYYSLDNGQSVPGDQIKYIYLVVVTERYNGKDVTATNHQESVKYADDKHRKIAKEIAEDYKARKCPDCLGYCVSSAVLKYGLGNTIASLSLMTTGNEKDSAASFMEKASRLWICEVKHLVVRILYTDVDKADIDVARRMYESYAASISKYDELAIARILDRQSASNHAVFVVGDCGMVHLWYRLLGEVVSSKTFTTNADVFCEAMKGDNGHVSRVLHYIESESERINVVNNGENRMVKEKYRVYLIITKERKDGDQWVSPGAGGVIFGLEGIIH